MLKSVLLVLSMTVESIISLVVSGLIFSLVLFVVSGLFPLNLGRVIQTYGNFGVRYWLFGLALITVSYLLRNIASKKATD